MTVNRDLSYPRAVLTAVISDLTDHIEKEPHEANWIEFRSACELACKILEMYEAYDSVELVDLPAHMNGA